MVLGLLPEEERSPSGGAGTDEAGLVGEDHGLRAVSDFEYEIQMANMNARMEPNVETIFLMASDRHQFIASSLVKDIARLGGDTSQFVSKKVYERLQKKFAKA